MYGYRVEANVICPKGAFRIETLRPKADFLGQYSVDHIKVYPYVNEGVNQSDVAEKLPGVVGTEDLIAARIFDLACLLFMYFEELDEEVRQTSIFGIPPFPIVEILYNPSDAHERVSQMELSPICLLYYYLAHLLEGTGQEITFRH
jgi:hypothetical protein